MITLIKNELIKIFHKKSILILWGLMLLFCILNNVLYWTDYDQDGNYKYEEQENIEEEKKKLENELAKYDVNKPENISMYVTIQTKIDLYNLKEEFPKNSWQYAKIEDYFYELIYNRNLYTYKVDNPVTKQQLELEYQEKYNYLKQNHWKYFLEIEIKKQQEEQTLLKQEITTTSDKLKQTELKSKLQEITAELKILNYRIQEQIVEDNSYLNQALENYQKYTKIVQEYESKENNTYEEQTIYQTALSNKKINEYILKNKVNINKENTLNYQLRTIIEDYELFFVILIIMVTSIIICEEFQTGTIKILLIKPHSRCKILISKYFTSLLVLFISIVFLIIAQLLIGTLIFGTDSLTIPVVSYHYKTNTLIEHSVFFYMFLRICAKLPFFIILSMISMCIGVLSTNNLITLWVPLLLYLFQPTIQNLSIQHNLTFIKYFICMNWNFEDYLFGGISEYPFVQLSFSTLIWILHFVIIGIIIIRIFQKKDIKNI